jgi:MOSC domain-containing protein YiiM
MDSEKDISGSNSGEIYQINASKGGVPKLPLPEAEINILGLVGDRQGTPEIHGGLERALCLYSLERITGLQEEGHPIYPGAVGENVTIAGLEWSMVVPGVRLHLGPEVIIEITSYTTPCNSIASVFTDSQYARISQSKHPGWSRVYARVLHPGSIRAGDEVYILS